MREFGEPLSVAALEMALARTVQLTVATSPRTSGEGPNVIARTTTIWGCHGPYKGLNAPPSGGK